MNFAEKTRRLIVPETMASRSNQVPESSIGIGVIFVVSLLRKSKNYYDKNKNQNDKNNIKIKTFFL